MSVADLNKRFINTFLYLQVVITTSPCVCQLITPLGIQGKLYTQIDTEDFPVAQSNLLDQFRALISKSPLPLSTDRLVQGGGGKYLIMSFKKYFPSFRSWP